MEKILTVLLLTIFMLIACSGNNDEQIGSAQNPIDFSMGISFPPVADNEQRDFTKPLLAELDVDRIRIGENWSFREPSEGNFNWEPLDERIQWAQDNNIEIFLTIQSNGPDWACSSQQNSNSCVYNDNDEFKNYIEQLLQRYPNEISKIQFGNEWQTDFWYIGNEQQFVSANNIVFNAIQEYSPNTKFVLGGFTTISLRFLAGCNGLIDEFYDDEGILYDQAYLEANCNSNEIQSVIDRIEYVLENALYDIVDIHLYDDVENWNIYFQNIKTMVQKPILISEFGGPNVNIEPETEQYQSDQLEKYIKTIDLMDVDETYFFKLIEGGSNPAHSKSGLIDDTTLSKKISFSTFEKYNR
ncbi:beta-galactosidase [Winogradskyella maritima]|uniref:Beta-galactosidase n=1 Tax=Winogradskyella maritima TaxID=1517766 RepID=A0ABV8AF25_9FLAO|nr:beta-galactosidase [Winogradskyella maritima]